MYCASLILLSGLRMFFGILADIYERCCKSYYVPAFPAMHHLRTHAPCSAACALAAPLAFIKSNPPAAFFIESRVALRHILDALSVVHSSSSISHSVRLIVCWNTADSPAVAHRIQFLAKISECAAHILRSALNLKTVPHCLRHGCLSMKKDQPFLTGQWS